MQLWFGKYRNIELGDIPESYLCWMIDAMEKESLRELARNELRRRQLKTSAQPGCFDTIDSVTREVLETGYRILAKKFHPDLGGDLAKMQELNAAMEKLRK